MLVSFLLMPGAFGAGVIESKADRQAAEALFKDILDVGIVVDYQGRPTLSEIEKNVERLPPQLKQRLLIFIEEMKKQRKVLFATPADGESRSLEQLAKELRPDAAVVPPRGASVEHALESVSIEDYLDSVARRRVEDFRSPRVPAAHLDASKLDELLGRFLKYSRSVTIMDKMLGRSAKDGVVGSRFSNGVEFVAKCWSRNSVYREHRLELVVVTVAGNCGASGGFVDPNKVAQAIRRSLAHVATTLKVVLKQDSSPGVFHARFLKVRGRCCKLDPGIDALGSGVGRSLCLQLDPPCEATNAIALDILKLPELADAVQ